MNIPRITHLILFFTTYLFIMGCVVAQVKNEESTNFRFNHNQIILDFDSTISSVNFKHFLIKNKKREIVRFKNIPNNVVERLDSYGRVYNMVDSISVFTFFKIDTLQTPSHITLKFSINKNIFDTISFRYQILSTTKRISESSFGKINVSDVGKLLEKECVGLKNPVIILSGFRFYDKEKLYHIGVKLCVIIQ